VHNVIDAHDSLREIDSDQPAQLHRSAHVAPYWRIAAGRGCTLCWSSCRAALAVGTPPGRQQSLGQFQEANPTVARCTGGRKCDPPRGGRITGRSPPPNPAVPAHGRGRKTAGRFSAPPPPKPPAVCSRWSWGRRPGWHQGCLAPYPPMKTCGVVQGSDTRGLRQGSPAWLPPPPVPAKNAADFRPAHARCRVRGLVRSAKSLPLGEGGHPVAGRRPPDRPFNAFAGSPK